MATQKPKGIRQNTESNPVLVPVGEISNTTQGEYLFTGILDAILDLRLSPGIKLKEDELADIFSVSRTVVRRALLRLSYQ